MAYGIVSKIAEYVMPEHVREARLIKYIPGQKPEEYQLKESVKYPGLHLIRQCKKYGIDYVYTPRKLRGSWLWELLYGVKIEAVKPGTGLDSIIQKIEAKYKKKEKVPKESSFTKSLGLI